MSSRLTKPETLRKIQDYIIIIIPYFVFQIRFNWDLQSLYPRPISFVGNWFFSSHLSISPNFLLHVSLYLFSVNSTFLDEGNLTYLPCNYHFIRFFLSSVLLEISSLFTPSIYLIFLILTHSYTSKVFTNLFSFLLIVYISESHNTNFIITIRIIFVCRTFSYAWLKYDGHWIWWTYDINGNNGN